MTAPRPTEPAGERSGNRPYQYVVLALVLALLGWLAVRRGVLAEGHVWFFALLVPSVILHEIAHGVAALAFGDDTAQRAGRLTLNPIAHIDPFWTILLPAMMVMTTGTAFGMAKPVPVNPRRMRHPRNHSLLTALAGPATNIALALVALAVFRIAHPTGTVAVVVALFGLANVVLAAFNLIPIPPLDGSAVLERILPVTWLTPYLRLRRYSFFIFIGLFLMGGGVLARIIDPAVDLWFRALGSST